MTGKMEADRLQKFGGPAIQRFFRDPELIPDLAFCFISRN
jgi:hypothetical protein